MLQPQCGTLGRVPHEAPPNTKRSVDRVENDLGSGSAEEYWRGIPGQAV